MATWTEADLVELEAAIKSGVKEVMFSGPPQRRVVYADIMDMIAARDRMRSEIAIAATTRKPLRLVQTKKGF